jgi:GT2 family glycosyltransferase
VAALNCGLAAARGAIVAFIDDDAVPNEDWLERIVMAFEPDERVAAVGGRDVVHIDGRVISAGRRRLPRRLEVGRIRWFGRMVANHHLGTGGPRDVDVLKGTNMSFRRMAVVGHGFDERLCGEGAVVHSEMSICLPLRRQGLRIVYDPGIVVQHYPAPRPHGDERALRSKPTFAVAHNEALQIFEYFGPGRRLVFLAWGLVIGTTDAPGLAVLARDCLRRRPAAWVRFIAAQRGKAAAWRTRRTLRPIPAPLAGRASGKNGHDLRPEALDAFSG